MLKGVTEQIRDTMTTRSCLDCGGALRRSNTDGRCAACARRASGEHLIPPTFWYADDMVPALADWDLPAVVRLLHRKLGLSQVALGSLTGYSQGHISRWLHQEGKPGGSAAQRLREFVENLAIPWELVGLVDPAAPDAPNRPHKGPSGNDGAAEKDGSAMKRRTVVVTASLALGATALGSASTDIWQGTLGSTHAKHLHQTTRRLAEQNYRFGGDRLFTQAVAQFETAHGKIRAGDYDPRAEAELFGAIGGLASITAWIAHDSGRDHDARFYFNEALLAARLSDNRQLAMSTYYSMSVKAEDEGHSRESLNFVKAAQRAAQGWAPGRILSLLACAGARSSANLKDLAQSRTLMVRAHSHFDKDHGDDFSDLLPFYNRAELTSFTGLVYLKQRSYKEAEANLRKGLAEHVTERGASYLRCASMINARLAVAQLGQSNITDSAQTGSTVLSAGTDGALSTRTLRVVKSLATALAGYGKAPTVRSFQEQYRSVIV